MNAADVVGLEISMRKELADAYRDAYLEGYSFAVRELRRNIESAHFAAMLDMNASEAINALPKLLDVGGAILAKP